MPLAVVLILPSFLLSDNTFLGGPAFESPTPWHQIHVGAPIRSCVTRRLSGGCPLVDRTASSREQTADRGTADKNSEHSQNVVSVGSGHWLDRTGQDEVAE